MQHLGNILISIEREGDDSRVSLVAGMNRKAWTGADPHALLAVGFAAIQRAAQHVGETDQTGDLWEIRDGQVEPLQIRETDGVTVVGVMAPTADERVVTGDSDNEDEAGAATPYELYNLRGRNVFRNQRRIVKAQKDMEDHLSAVFQRVCRLTSASDEELSKIATALRTSVPDYSPLLDVAGELEGLGSDDLQDAARRIRAFVSARTVVHQEPIVSKPVDEVVIDDEGPE